MVIDKKQEIKDAIDIVDLVSEYTQLTPSGHKMKGLSPFTNEKTPSFFVDPTDGVYYCFSSQKGGDVFTFVQEMEGVDFKGALKILADRAGIDLEVNSHINKKAPMYKVLEETKNIYINNLTKEVSEYLLSRGIDKEAIKFWGVGYASDKWNSICERGLSNNDKKIITGLCVKKDKGAYDRFRNRIMFPLFDTQGRVLGFSGREYKEETGAKYINSPESILFNKSEYIYGLNIAKKNIRKYNFSILTEGTIDTIMVHSAGFPVSVATCGTSVTIEHLKQLKRLSNRIILALDSDPAGIRATLKVIEKAFSIGMDVKVLELEEKMDPADVILKDKNKFSIYVKDASSPFKFIKNHIQNEYGEKNEDKLRGIKEVFLPILPSITDPMLFDFAVNEAAEFANLSTDAIKKSIPKKIEHRTIKYKKNIIKKITKLDIDKLKNFVVTAKIFLDTNNINISSEFFEKMKYVEKNVDIGNVDKKVVKLHFEEKFKDEKTRNEKVYEEYKDMLNRLYNEISRKQELEKMNNIE